MNPKRISTTHTGVFYREKQAADGKTVRTYYVLFKRDGRLIETKVGLSTRGMTVAKAAQLRAQMVDGRRQTAAERRLEIAQNPDLTSCGQCILSSSKTSVRVQHSAATLQGSQSA